MRRSFALLLALVLTFSAIPAAAAAPIQVLVNGKAVEFPDALPYVDNETVMVPIRVISEALDLRIAFKQQSQELTLYSSTQTTTFTIGGSKAAVNEKQISFQPAAASKQHRAYVPLSFLEDVLGLHVQLDESKQHVSIQSHDSKTTALRVIELLTEEQHQKLYQDYFHETLKEAVPAEQLQAALLEIEQAAGAYSQLQDLRTEPYDEQMTAVYALLDFEQMAVELTMILDNESLKLTGLLLQLAAPEQALPDTVAEEEIVLGEGTKYPLKGTLTLPAHYEAPLKAVVLVHGSGPNDRDETAGAYKPFRDIAWGLAEQGIAVLRYEKRTFAHGASFTEEEALSFSVKEETVDDAIMAGDWLKQDERIDASQVYVIGHSLGGMLAPRIDAEGGDFAGLVILAGTPRTLWEIIYDQNLYFIDAMDADDPEIPMYLAMVEEEMEKARSIADMTDEEAQAAVVFGMPAYYFKEMDRHSTASYAAKLRKPVLVMQGESDFQVYADPDYILWKEVLSNNSNATFKLYPGLNHFFVHYEGPSQGTLYEYNFPGQVSEEVIKDIASWLNSLK